jgi:hypothetical protein
MQLAVHAGHAHAPRPSHCGALSCPPRVTSHTETLPRPCLVPASSLPRPCHVPATSLPRPCHVPATPLPRPCHVPASRSCACPLRFEDKGGWEILENVECFVKFVRWVPFLPLTCPAGLLPAARDHSSSRYPAARLRGPPIAVAHARLPAPGCLHLATCALLPATY